MEVRVPEPNDLNETYADVIAADDAAGYLAACSM